MVRAVVQRGGSCGPVLHELIEPLSLKQKEEMGDPNPVC